MKTTPTPRTDALKKLDPFTVRFQQEAMKSHEQLEQELSTALEKVEDLEGVLAKIINLEKNTNTYAENYFEVVELAETALAKPLEAEHPNS